MDTKVDFVMDDVVLDDPKPGDDGVGKKEDSDPVLDDIRALFGDDKGDGAESSDDKDPFKDFKDDKSPRDPKALLQRLQSERDSYRDRLKNYENELKEYKPIADFMASLYEDEEARAAFIGELAPDLVKPKDPLTFIQEGLKKEFGADFTPNKEEAGVIGSKTWLYNERGKDLLQAWKEKNAKTPSNLKSLAERRKKAREDALKAAEREKQEIMSKFKWDDTEWEEFSKWAPKFRGIHLADIWTRAKKAKGGKRSPLSPTGIPGGKPFVPSQFKKELDEMFGAN